MKPILPARPTLPARSILRARPILRASLVVALALPGGAHAQQLPGSGRADTRPGEPPAAALRDTIRSSTTAFQDPPADAPVPGRQKVPRSEKAIGPDLMAYVFAPIGAIVNPLTRGLHGVDAALAPINEALLPLTAPLDPVLFQPAAEPVPEAAAEPVKPGKAGLRK